MTWFFDVERNVSIKKKRENGENIFFKALANRFSLTSKLISWVKEQEQQHRLWTPSIKWTSRKGNFMSFKVY